MRYVGMSRYVVRRVWLLPFLVCVWDIKWLPIVDWKYGDGFLEHRLKTFYRRRTAEKYVKWLEEGEAA